MATHCPHCLARLLDAIRGIDDRLNTLERKMSDQISIITEHIESQNNTFRRVNEERQSLQKITELLSNAEADMKNDKAKPQTEQNRIHVPAVSTHNRFEIFTEEADIKNPSQSCAEQIAEYRQRQRTQDIKQYDVIVAGDSMLKHIDSRRLSRGRNVKCHSLPGAKVEQVSPSSVCESLKSQGEAIIHAGTNNCMEGPRSVHDKIVSLCEAVCSTGRRACISGIIHRRWETPYERKRIDTLNYRLKTTADERGWGFIDNSNVGERHLGVDGVHLNKLGQSVFAGNLCRHINRHQRHSMQREHLNQRRDEWNTPLHQRPSRQREHLNQRREEGNTPLHQRHSSQREHLNQRRDEWNPPMHQPSQPRSYAETVAGESTTSSTARGVQQDFNMEFRRSRIKPSSHPPVRSQNPSQWQDYLQFVRKVTSAGSH